MSPHPPTPTVRPPRTRTFFLRLVLLLDRTLPAVVLLTIMPYIKASDTTIISRAIIRDAHYFCHAGLLDPAPVCRHSMQIFPLFANCAADLTAMPDAFPWLFLLKGKRPMCFEFRILQATLIKPPPPALDARCRGF